MVEGMVIQMADFVGFIPETGPFYDLCGEPCGIRAQDTLINRQSWVKVNSPLDISNGRAYNPKKLAKDDQNQPK